MTLHIQLPPEIEARLLARAAAANKDPSVYAMEALQMSLSTDDGPFGARTPQEKTEAWNRFVDKLRASTRHLPKGHFVDDRREKTYEGRGE